MRFITIDRETPRDDGGRERRRWTFWYDDRVHGLRCSTLRVERKRPRGRTFRLVEEWSQHRGNRNPEDLPTDVVTEAVAQFRAGLRYVPWEDR